MVEEEIDLRIYVEALAKRWYIIVGFALLLGIIVFVANTLAAPQYEASALIAFIEPRQRLQFDERFQTAAQKQSFESFPQLALSDQTLIELQESLPGSFGGMTLADLLAKLRAAPGNDPSFIRLTAVDEDPALAAELVNKWAEVFVLRANRLIGNQGGEELAFFQQQLELTKAILEDAEHEMIQFQSENYAELLSNELSELSREQQETLRLRHELELLQQDVGSLQEQVASQDLVTFADQFTALGLQVKAFDLLPAEGGIQLQVASDIELTSASRTEQLAYLENLQASINTKLADLTTRLADLKPLILSIQEERQVFLAEEDRLKRDRDVAQETYISLARKVDEERISSADVNSVVRLVSTAAIPGKPSGPKRLINTAIAIIVGLLIGVFAALAIEWWQVGRQQ